MIAAGRASDQSFYFMLFFQEPTQHNQRISIRNKTTQDQSSSLPFCQHSCLSPSQCTHRTHRPFHSSDVHQGQPHLRHGMRGKKCALRPSGSFFTIPGRAYLPAGGSYTPSCRAAADGDEEGTRPPSCTVCALRRALLTATPAAAPPLLRCVAVPSRACTPSAVASTPATFPASFILR